MTPRAWSIRLGWILDALGLGSLAATSEVHGIIFGCAGLVLLLSRTVLRGRRVSQNLMLFLYGLVFAGALLAWLGMRVHPVVVAASGTPLIHALLWLPTQTGNDSYRSLRLGIGFVELVLAAVLTAELYLPVAIIAFAILGAVTLATAFLDQELTRNSPEHSGDPLPRAYIREGLLLAVVIFLSSALIFPLLPRMKGSGSWLNPGTRAGYTESVDISHWSTVSGPEDQRPVLRLYSDSVQDLATEIHLGLIRSRALDVFDGKHWQPLSGRQEKAEERFVPPGAGRAQTRIEIEREALHTEALPVPYGTIYASTVESDGTENLLGPERNGEWHDPRSSERRLLYRVTTVPTIQRHLTSRREIDAPVPADLEVPESMRTHRIKNLVARIFAGTRTERQKTLALLSFFKNDGFAAAYGLEDEPEAGSPLIDQAMRSLNPLEQFLFIRKAGHCEWFASSSAILLRLAGVPTRLVAGFRLTHRAVGGVLTVRNSDAHAWLEAWSPDSGWFPLDPTPRLIAPPTFLEFFRGTYDMASAFWYRYIVSYDGEQFADAGRAASVEMIQSIRQDPAKALRRYPALFAGFGVGLLALAISLLRSRLARVLPGARPAPALGPAVLRRERARMEKLLRARSSARLDSTTAELERALGAEGAATLGEWKRVYERARFGPAAEEALPSAQRELRARFDSLRTRSTPARYTRAGS